MLTQQLPALKSFQIILASSSPRRLELLQHLGLEFAVCPSTFEENLDPASFASPELYVRETARRKAEEVRARYKPSQEPWVLIAADTIVVLDGRVLEKPRDHEDASSMLQSLSGRSHQVYSAVVLMKHNHQGAHIFHEKTNVEMGVLSPETIASFVETGEPMDKSGAYGIQVPQCASFIKTIHGCYNNVVGFPVHRFCIELCNFLHL